MSGAKVKLASISVLALAVGLSSVAHAQSVELPLPPVRAHVDERGVDLTSGQVAASEADLSIGAAGTAGLAHQRVWAGTNGWRHGYMLSATADGAGHVTLALGASSVRFTMTNGAWAPDEGDGSTLVETAASYSYTASDGTAIFFDKSYAANSPSYYGLVGSVATSITSPTGQKTILAYKLGNYTATVMNAPVTFYAVRLQSVTNSNGYQLKYSYASNDPSTGDAWGKIAQVAAINNAYEACDPNADACSTTTNWPTVSYAQAPSNGGTVETVTDAESRAHVNTVDGSGRLMAIRRPGASADSITYAYDTNSNVYSVNVNGVGSSTYNFATDNTGAFVATVNELTIPSPRILVSDPATRQVRSDADENGRTTHYDNDPSTGRLLDTIAPEGNKVAYEYDGRGNVKTTTVSSKLGSAQIVTRALYPSTCDNPATCNKPQSTTDADNHTTDYHYNPNGTLDYVQLPAVNGVRPERHYSYASAQASVKTAGGGYTALDPVTVLSQTTSCRTGAWPCAALDQAVQTARYASGSGNNIQVVSSSTAIGDGSFSSGTSFSYDQIGNTTTTTDAANRVTTQTYNRMRQVTGTVAPSIDGTPGHNRAVTVNHYRFDGLQDSLSVGTAYIDGSGYKASSIAGYNYDVAGRKILDVTYDGSGMRKAVTQYSYDTRGRLLCGAQRMNPAAYDSLPDACTQSTAGADGPDRITHYIIEYAGAIDTVQTGWGTSLVEDSARYIHTQNGRVQTVTGANGDTTSYAYDGFDRPLRTCYNASADACANGSASDYEAYTFDDAGNLINRRTRAGQMFTFQYDALNRLTSKTTPSMRPTYYAYDLAGHLTAARFDSPSGGDAVTASYDAIGRLGSSTTTMGSNIRNLSYAYDPVGAVVRLTHPDGAYFDMTYDGTGQMNHASWWGPASGTVPFFGIAYDDLGRRTQTGRASSQTNYDYDGVSRLSGLNQNFADGIGNLNHNFAYNAASQLTAKARDADGYGVASPTADRSYTADLLNRYLSSLNNASGATTTYSYDGNGNLTGDGTNSYGYDAENHLTSASTSQGTTLTYDPLGRLYQIASPVFGKTQFVYDGDHVAVEYDGDTLGIRRRFFWGPGADEPIMQDEGGALNCSGGRFLHPDERGSIMAAADCWGHRTNVNAYDDHGVPASGNWGRYGYTGQAWLPELGLYYYKARFYSPMLGRFMQTDPIGLAGGPNLYAYVGNDPVNFKDPSGLAADEKCTTLYVNHGWQYSDGHVLWTSSTPFEFCAPNLAPASTNAYGAGRGEKYDPAKAKAQRDECHREPFKSALADSTVQARLNETRQRTATDYGAGSKEYGFRTRSFGGIRGTTPVFTSQQSGFVDMRSESLWWPPLGEEVDFHAHLTYPTHLSEGDFKSDVKNLVVIDKNGETFCAGR